MLQFPSFHYHSLALNLLRKMTHKIPTISICSLLGHDCSAQDLMVYDLQDFMDSHKDIVFPHRHSFYQILWITKGSGNHIIDFENAEVKRNRLFFLSPKQVHEWVFDEDTNGVLINFNENFFSSFLANHHYLSDFPFFSGMSQYCTLDLDHCENGELMKSSLKAIQHEFKSHHSGHSDMIRSLLLQLFIAAARCIKVDEEQHSNSTNLSTMKSFEQLIESNFKELRLPKDYAKKLFISPNHLNAVCNQITGKSAGELIRNRVLLEAKRLLINSDDNINEIAAHLNFFDNSYFSKFFKKYEGLTPEEFRKQTTLGWSRTSKAPVESAHW